MCNLSINRSPLFFFFLLIQYRFLSSSVQTLVDIVHVSAVDKDEIRAFLMEHYFPDDQTLLASGDVTPSSFQVEAMVNILEENLSFKVVTQRDNEICGVILNGEIGKQTADMYEKYIQICPCQKYKKVKFWFQMADED